MDSLIDDPNNNAGFLGEGNYGCVYYPGIDCKGKKNTKKTVTKVQEINFYSINEKNIGLHIKKYIKNFKNHFGSIMKACIVSFDIIEKSDLHLKKCSTLFEDYGSNNSNSSSSINNTHDTNFKHNVNNEYYLMYSYYIKNKSLQKYYSDYVSSGNYVISILNHFSYLLSSLTLLNKVYIIHNDLHVNNILINLKTNKPIIIDFGLSFKIKKCYKLNKNTIDFYYLKKFIFDFRVDHYHVNIEKRFLCFFIYNTNKDFNSIVDDDNAVNLLTNDIIDLFIYDSYDSIANNEEIREFFNTNELIEYKKALREFYYQFSNKTDYPTYTSIAKYLLDFVHLYTDLYSLTIDLLYVYYNSKFFLEKNSMSENKNYKIFLEFFIQLYKKVLYPNPNTRLKINEVYIIYMFIINYIKKIEINDDNNYTAAFIVAFTTFLKSKSISIQVVFNKTFAYMNFNLLCNKTMFEFIKLHI
jgi:tRNA A-37 threonylcarbamoyl transferase component Bud32